MIGTQAKHYRIPLPDSEDDVLIEFPWPMTEAQWDCFITLLQLFKLGMVAPTDDAAVAGHPARQETTT